MSGYELRLLGRPRLTHSGADVPLQPKALALMAYLSRQPGSRTSREVACSLLWPEEPPENARHSLRQLLWSLRQATETHLLSSTRDQLSLDPAVASDIGHVLRYLDSGSGAALDDRSPLVLYEGPFLQGYESVGGPEFEDWLLGEREYLHRRFSHHVLEICSSGPGNGEGEGHVALLERLLRFDPLDETIAATLMSLYHQRGEDGLALRVYRALTTALERELGADPPERLKVLYQSLVDADQRRALEAENRLPTVDNTPRQAAGLSLVAMTYVHFQGDETSWPSLSVHERARLLGECHYFVQRVASRFGVEASERMGSGHLFVFGAADAAADFGLKACEAWQRVQLSASATPIDMRIAAHVGEATTVTAGRTWIGRGVLAAQRIAVASPWQGLVVTENLLDLLPAARYSVEASQRTAIDGDHLGQRTVYLLAPAAEGELPLPPEARAEALCLRAMSFVGTPKENGPDEEALYREVLALSPRHAEAHNNLAVLLRQQGRHQEAAVHYRQAIASRPGYPEAHYNYAVLLESSGNVSAAMDHYRTALQLRPDYVDAHMRYAVLLAAREQRDEATMRYERVLQLRPGYAEAHNNYAILLEDMGDRESARRHYHLALREKPDYVEARYNLALHYESDGESGEAEEHYRQALALLPDFVEARSNLAALLFARGALEDALTHYRLALESRPNDPETNYNYAVVLEAVGEHAAAETHFRVAREFTPSGAPFASTIEH